MHKKRTFAEDWKQFKEELKYPFGNSNKEYLITERELGALKNLVHLARERLWLVSNWPKKPEYHTVYDEIIVDDHIRIAEESVQVVDAFLRENAERLNVPLHKKR